MTATFDAVIVGTGQAGTPLARSLAGAGHTVAIVERHLVGGSCVNYGCTPTKTMLASARVAQLARHAEQWGVRAGEVEVDLGAVVARKRRVVEGFRESSRRGLEEAGGVELVFGHGRLTGPRAVEVELADGGRRRLTARRWVFLNTGTRPSLPDIDGIHGVPTLDNRTVMELEEAPGHLLVLGGGYIGCELGQMFRRFGSAVTVIQRGARLLGREDADVSDGVAEILRADGVEILFAAETTRVKRADGGIALTVALPGGERRLAGSHLLVAAGRTPNTDDLGLDAAGVATDDRGYVPVNDRLETGVPGIYALGDVHGGPAFTHASYDDFRVVARNLLGEGGASRDGRQVPYVLFTDPQLGRIGLGEEEAEEQGREVRVAKLPMTEVARAIETGETRGFMKAVVDAGSGEILGCAILGREGGEAMAVVQVAMMGRLPYTALRDGVFAHPTLAESLNNLFSKLDD